MKKQALENIDPGFPKRVLKRLKHSWMLTLGTSFGVMGIAWVALGATYNIYFNNVEQGNNSTATPNVSINTGEKPPVAAASPVPSAIPAIEAVNPPTPVPPAEQPAAKTTAALPETGEDGAVSRRHRWRLMALGGYVLQSGSGITPEISLGYSFAKSLTLSLYASPGSFGGYSSSSSHYGYGSTASELSSAYPSTAMIGAELEVTPFRIAMGRTDDLVDLGLLLGASTYGRSEGNVVSLDAGARATVNIGEQFGVTIAARGNLAYKMVETGIVIRL
jgi:hypothetical protein